MHQTAYLGVNNLIKGMPYMGGICKLWFIPKEEVESIPPVDPLNQYLLTDIVLKSGKAWRGPVPLPDSQLGITETMEVSKAGISYKVKVTSTLPGELPQSRVNIDNMAYHEYILVGKLRAGGFYIVIGNTETGAYFDTEATTGNGSISGPAFSTKIIFTHDQPFKPLVLPSFAGAASGYIYPSPSGGSSGSTNDYEIIYINNESNKTVSWTPTRQTRFGVYPIVEVWLQDSGGTYYLAAVQPYIDAPPPSFTLMTFDFGANVTGFIILK